jgi:hypothetical protein
MVVDEIPLAPELLRAIKVLVDLDPRPLLAAGPDAIAPRADSASSGVIREKPV